MITINSDFKKVSPYGIYYLLDQNKIVLRPYEQEQYYYIDQSILNQIKKEKKIDLSQYKIENDQIKFIPSEFLNNIKQIFVFLYFLIIIEYYLK